MTTYWFYLSIEIVFGNVYLTVFTIPRRCEGSTPCILCNTLILILTVECMNSIYFLSVPICVTQNNYCISLCLINNNLLTLKSVNNFHFILCSY